MNTKLADEKRCLWRLGLVLTPILMASMIAWSKIADYWHHPGDVLAGAIIGSVFAYVVFRYQYFPVWVSGPKEAEVVVV